MTILAVIIVAALVGMIAARSVITKKQKKMLEAFLLPEGSDRESFMDEKTDRKSVV